jgi:RNA polymerase sigma-70 factor (ECF subfamily)
MSGDSDHDLVLKIRAGDEAAFTEVVHRYQASIRGFTAIWAPSRDEADDIAQEVFIGALRNIQSFDTSKDLKLWLLGIARNHTRSAWRRVSRQPQGGKATALEDILDRHAMDVHAARFEKCDDRRDALQVCMQSLPAKTREIFTKYFVDGVTSADLAELMLTTENTVRATISRIRMGLRQCIERRVGLEAAE